MNNGSATPAVAPALTRKAISPRHCPRTLRAAPIHQAPTSGRVLVGGEDIWAGPPRAAARKVAAVLQEQPGAFGLSVREVVTLGRTPHRLGYSTPGAADAEIVNNALDRMELRHIEFRDLGNLSGGERQRVMVARALAQQPQLPRRKWPSSHATGKGDRSQFPSESTLASARALLRELRLHRHRA